MSEKKGIRDGEILTPEFRVAFPYLFTPRPAQDAGKKPTYEVTMLFPPTADLAPLKKALFDVMVAKHGADKARWPKGFKFPLRDGNESSHLNGFAGMTFAAARSTIQPGIVDQRVQPILDPKKIYPGCWCRAVIKPSWFEMPTNKGLKFFLNHIQLLRDDEPLVARARPEDVFAAVAGGGEAAADDFSGDSF